MPSSKHYEWWLADNAQLAREDHTAANAHLAAQEVLDLRKQVSALASELRELRAWQEQVAEGTGYLNRAEGSGGYEVAPPETVLAAWQAAQYARTLLLEPMTDTELARLQDAQTTSDNRNLVTKLGNELRNLEDELEEARADRDEAWARIREIEAYLDHQKQSLTPVSEPPPPAPPDDVEIQRLIQKAIKDSELLVRDALRLGRATSKPPGVIGSK